MSIRDLFNIRAIIMRAKENSAKKIIRNLYYSVKNIKCAILYHIKEQVEIPSNCVILVTHDLECQGAPVLLLNIVKNFKESGIPVLVISLKNGPMFKQFYDLVPVRVIDPSRIVLFIQKQKEGLFRRVAYCNTVVSGNVVKELHENGFQIVTLVHELKQLIVKSHYEDRCEKIAQHSKCVVFPSSLGLHAFEDVINKKMYNYCVMNQGLFNFDCRNITKEVAKKHIANLYGIDESYDIVLNVATAGLRKGIDLFLEIYHKVYKRKKNICFIWVGDKIESYITNKKLETDFNTANLVTPGYVKNIDLLYDFYLAADLYCLTSREEPFGSVVLESFNAGTPVLAFRNCGGYIDVVKENETGFLIEPFNTDEYAWKIESLLANKEKLNEYGANCKAEAKKHNFKNYCNRLLELGGL